MASPNPKKTASFDVLGTCFSFSTAITKIQSLLFPTPSSSSSSSSSPQDQQKQEQQQNHTLATTLFFSWFYAAQRDFTYASLSGSYIPIAKVLRATFRRACATSLPSSVDITDADLDSLMEAMMQLEPREGLKACWDGLRDAGWGVLAVTNGGRKASGGYFERAGIQIRTEGKAEEGGELVSCDDFQVAKPDGRVYEAAKGVLEARGLLGGSGQDDGGERWFVAAHAWDLMAARKAGFKTAYLDFEEHDAVGEVFGEFDLYASSMEELLEKLKQL